MHRLDEWYKEAKVGMPNMLDWLKQKTPEEWHLATIWTSYDGDQKILAWVIDQPECEISTAIEIFWQGAPADQLKDILIGNGELPLYSDDFVIMKRIADNLLSGFYASKNIAFPPPEKRRSLRDYEKSFERYREAVSEVVQAGKLMPWELPEMAFQELKGRTALSDYSIEGGEVHLNYRLWCTLNPE